ncbi:chorismate mutase, partial [Ruminococcus sp.]
MELNEIRVEIDKLDRELQQLFEQRMQLCREVAQYKKA